MSPQEEFFAQIGELHRELCRLEQGYGDALRMTANKRDEALQRLGADALMQMRSMYECVRRYRR